jgi:hypothetical protein
LSAYLDDGAPAEAMDHPRWPAGLQPPGGRAVGFLHQASQWSAIPRYEQAVSTIKEACLRAWEAGLEGVGIHGEVSSRHIPWALNYLAFSHFIHWPEDTLRDFGRRTLGQVFGNEQEGEAFAELLAGWDAGTLAGSQENEIAARARELQGSVGDEGSGLARWRFWHWLHRVAEGAPERHTVSFL